LLKGRSFVLAPQIKQQSPKQMSFMKRSVLKKTTVPFASITDPSSVAVHIVVLARHIARWVSFRRNYPSRTVESQITHLITKEELRSNTPREVNAFASSDADKHSTGTSFCYQEGIAAITSSFSRRMMQIQSVHL